MHGEESVTFLRTLARAEALSGDEDWEGAARLWPQVVDVNPVEGRFWSKLGEARERAKAYREAITAYDKALALRDGFPAETAYRLACCHALLGEREEALANLEQALALRFRHLDRAAKDEDLAVLRDDPHFRELAGLIDADELSRDEGWRYDLRFLAREVSRRAYDPFRFSPREQFDAAVAHLDDAIPSLSDLQIVVEMNRLLRITPLLHALGVTPSPDEVALTLRGLNGETREIVLEPGHASPREHYFHHPEEWIFLPDTLSSPPLPAQSARLLLVHLSAGRADGLFSVQRRTGRSN